MTAVSLSSPAGRVIAAVADSIGAELACVEMAEDRGLHDRNLSLARAALTRLGESGVRGATHGRLSRRAGHAT